MKTHNFCRWLVILTLVLIGNLMLGQAVRGVLQIQFFDKAITLSEPQDPMVPIAKAAPLEQTNTITPTMSLENRERYQADVEAARLNEARKLTAPASNLTAIDETKLLIPEPDSDDDGMPDAWETANGLNPNDPSDAWTDLDGDEVINLFEYQLSSDPNNAATPTVVTVSVGGNVEAALDAAASGQLIRVEGGSYNVNYLTFTPKTIMVQGGWNSGFTERDLKTNPTIFDGKSVDEVLYFSYSSGSNAVILDGLTLINGQGNFGALNMIAQGTSVMKWSLMNTVIRNSESTSSSGGAFYVLHWNSSESDVFIINSNIANNQSSGIKNHTTSAAVGRWKIINSNITNNQSADAGEGYGLEGFTLDTAILSIKARNTILWGNQQPDIEVRRSITVEAEYSDIGTVNTSSAAIYIPGTGVLNSDPLFTDVNTNDFTLQKTSPVIDTGTNIGIPSTDLVGNPRPIDGNLDNVVIADIGAIEYFDPLKNTYLPLIMKLFTPPPPGSATNTPTPTSTHTPTPSPTFTPTPTHTPTNTPTITPTSTNTPVPGPAKFIIINNTGNTLDYTLTGPTSTSGSISNGQTKTIDVTSGEYTVSATASCGNASKIYTIDPGEEITITYICQ